MTKNYFLNRDQLAKKTATIDQFAYIRHSVLDDGRGRGSRIARVANGSGLDFTVNVERGLDIADASFKGIALAWMTPACFVAPAFYEQQQNDWLNTWGGGMLTGCGLVSAGNPNDPEDRNFGLHGRISHIPAENVRCERGWQGDKFVQSISADVRQSRVFAENLLMTRKITAVMGENSILIEDTIDNQGKNTSPLMMLYHVNVGYPVLDAGATLEARGHEILPRNEHTKANLDTWSEVTEPQSGFEPCVYYHEIPAEENGFAKIELQNKKLGLNFILEYRTKELPYLIQWKNLDEGEYVTGLEPANCHPDGLVAERDDFGTLRNIEPGEKVSTAVKISLEEL